MFVLCTFTGQPVNASSDFFRAPSSAPQHVVQLIIYCASKSKKQKKKKCFLAQIGRFAEQTIKTEKTWKGVNQFVVTAARFSLTAKEMPLNNYM